MKKVEDLKVGDTVWYDDVNNRTKRPPVETKVLKIATKLITVEGGYNGSLVFRKDSLRTNDNYSHQWLILDLQDERDKKEKERLVSKFNRHFNVPEDVTLDDVRAALNLLRIPLD